MPNVNVLQAIDLKMEAVNTSETFVNIYYTTRLSIPEYSHLYTRCHENLKSGQNVAVRVNGIYNSVNFLVCHTKG